MQAATSSSAAANSPVEGDDWLAIAKSSSQTKRKSLSGPAAGRSKAAAPAAPGGWMSSGKLGLSTGDESDEKNVDKAGGLATTTAKPKKKKKQTKGPSSAAAGGPGGWLGSGALGVPTEDDEDDEDGGGDGGVGSDDGRGVAVTIETQTEDDIEAVTERGAAEKASATKLPPWAKPWTPPPKPEVVPEAPAEKEVIQPFQVPRSKQQAYLEWRTAIGQQGKILGLVFRQKQTCGEYSRASHNATARQLSTIAPQRMNFDSAGRGSQ